MQVAPRTRKLVATSVYGIIITTVLLLTLENHEDSPGDMIAAMVLTILGISVAEYYAASLGKGFGQTTKGKHFSIFELLQDFLHMTYGSIVPIAIFVVSAFGVISILVAFDVAEAYLGLALFGYGYWYGRSREASRPMSFLYGMLNVCAVGVIVWLKLSSHL